MLRLGKRLCVWLSDILPGRLAVLAGAMLLLVALLQQTSIAWAQAKPQLPAPSGEHGTSLDLYAAVERAVGLLSTGDTKMAKAELETVVNAPAFATLPGSAQFSAYFSLGLADYSLYLFGDAHKYTRLAGEAAPTLRSGIYWNYATQIAVHADDQEAAVAGLETLARDYPDIALALGDQYIFRILDMSSRRSARRDHVALLEALWVAGYQPSVGDQTMEIFWLELLASYLDQGQPAKAEEIAATVQRARSFVIMSVDARFGTYRPADPFGAQARALEAELVEARDLAADNPKDMARAEGLAASLRKLNRDDEALAVLQASLNALDEAPPGVRVFEDQDNFLDSVLSTKAEILLDRGDTGAAIAAQRLAVEVEESFGSITFWQRTKLAEMYVWLERPTEALDTLAGITRKDIGTYSVMTASEVRVCANQQLGNIDAARDELAEMEVHAAEAYAAYRMALLCVGDLDAVENLIISRIEDPRTRLNALVDLQRYPELATAPSYYRALVSAYDGLADRPTLKAVVEKYGRVLSWPLPGI